MSDDHERILSDDDIYFGSFQVEFKPVEGSTTSFTIEDWTENITPESVAIVVGRGKEQFETGAASADIIEPAIPALDFIRLKSPNQGYFNLFPPELQSPLIKVPLETGGVNALRGVASGTRSALIKVGHSWYRLKGCGNNDEGFVVRRNRASIDRPAWRDIRGCAFEHTALRELMMSARLGEAAKSTETVSCNESMGYYTYTGSEQTPLGAAFPTCCIVERTLGDRRIGSHVLSGLEIIFPLLIEEASIDVDALLAMFPPNRPRTDPVVLSGVVPTADLMCDLMMGSTMANDGTSHGISFPPERSRSELADASGFGLPMHAPNPDAPPPLQVTRAGSRVMNSSWRAQWVDNCTKLAALLDQLPLPERSLSVPLTFATPSAVPISTVLGYLFARLGHDAGRTMRTMHQERVSWGTYQDGMCHESQWHCNAHSNNLVLLPPGDTRSLIGFLDTDMAFDDKTYVDVRTGKVGCDETEFTKLLFMGEFILPYTFTNLHLIIQVVFFREFESYGVLGGRRFNFGGAIRGRGSR
jgi:hypothetical protein